MGKLKSPLLSLGAHGTVGDALTFQGNSRSQIVRTKPQAIDKLTLPRAYQRWDYQDYAYLWTQLSAADKEAWRPAASRRGISPFNAFMRDRLLTLPDLVGRWRLDEQAGATAVDSSKNTNSGTLFGTSPAAGLIAGCRSFDGIDDRIRITGLPLYNSDPWTWEFFFNPSNMAEDDSLIQDYFNGTNRTRIFQIAGSDLRFYIEEAGVAIVNFNTGHGNILNGTWYSVHMVHDPPDVHSYIDGVAYNSAVRVNPPIAARASTIYMGAWAGILDWLLGRIDHFTIYNRALDQTEITLHSARRYP